MPLRIANRDARRLWLAQTGLAAAPTGGPAPLDVIRRLGLLQLDSIPVVARAHHHILWSRCQSYRPPALDRLMRDRAVFEHFTHDASVLPIELYPIWTRQFRRRRARIDRHGYWGGRPDHETRAAIRARIAREGPLSSAAFEAPKGAARTMWQRPAHKVALDYMWHAGELATAHRRNFVKFYDLAERVIPEELRRSALPDAEQVARLCEAALDRLGFATTGDIQRFWDATDPAEVKAWIAAEGEALVPVEIEAAGGGWQAALAPADIEERLAAAPAATGRLRILNPFDPALRDRARLARLFGFDYRIEIFVPAAERRWGYYVLPLLEGDRFVGRIEARADRGDGCLVLQKLWSEPGIRWTGARQARLEAELARLARLAGCETARAGVACAPPPA